MGVFQTCLARCVYCGKTSVDYGAYSPSKQVTVQLAKDMGWTFKDHGGVAVCPPCSEERAQRELGVVHE